MYISSIDVDVFVWIVADTSLAEKESRDEKEQSGKKLFVDAQQLEIQGGGVLGVLAKFFWEGVQI